MNNAKESQPLVILTPVEKGRHFGALNSDKTPAQAWTAGYDARTDELNLILLGDHVAVDTVEMAFKAYGRGYEDGGSDADAIIGKFEDFARRVHGMAGDTLLKTEAAELLAALHASRTDDNSHSR